jgi:hypothetical protein
LAAKLSVLQSQCKAILPFPEQVPAGKNRGLHRNSSLILWQLQSSKIISATGL